ncbi:hypothetical protein SETIT_5G402000v2 [Setaria italica]|uniref:Uncharacterized protein n=1 Tax=Setaria italica TaxID=4555 RepID=A0A368RDW9_SETIT|nr:hypothetical protein SETIT_5G402000v2 [Setaria italica]
MDQVATIWQDGSDEQHKFQRSIMVHANSGETGWEDKKILLEEIPVVRFPRKRRKYTKCNKLDTNGGLLKDKGQSSCTRVETTQVDRYKRMPSRIVGGGAEKGSVLNLLS